MGGVRRDQTLYLAARGLFLLRYVLVYNLPTCHAERACSSKSRPRLNAFSSHLPAEDSTGRTGRASIEPGESLYALHVDLYVKPDRREEFLEAIRGDQEGALTSEDRCVAYLFGEDADEPNTFHMFEQYVDRAGFEQHAKSPHYGKWSEFKATEPFSASAKVAYYTTIESLDTNSDVQAKAAVSSAGAPPAGFEWGGVF